MTSGSEFDLDQGGGDDDGFGPAGGTNDAVPRPKRIACILCRKRKLRCDGNKPSCGTCSRLNHHCEYSEERKKSGPKRGYVKLLEARLKQVENLLESREPTTENVPHPGIPSTAQETYASIPPLDVSGLGDTSMSGLMPGVVADSNFTDPSLNGLQDFTDDFSWEMIGLGLEEALPARDVVDEL